MMTNYTLLTSIILSISFVLITACGGKTVERPAPILTPEQIQQQAQKQTAPTIPSGGNTASSSVKHYTCPNKCAGSGGDGEGTCPVCGTAYVHNQSFHNQITQGTEPITPPQNTSAEPDQNAAGVWHYTCSQGCAGGAGSAIACASCGGTLTHNTSYHN